MIHPVSPSETATMSPREPVRNQPVRLSAEHVAVHFGRRPALREVSLDFRPGELVAIVGPNGAGKSTMLRSLAGMLTPSHGRVRRSSGPDGRRLRISYVPQRSGVDWTFPVSVLDVVLIGAPTGGVVSRFLPYRAAQRRRALRELDAVGMARFAGVQIGELSGGQQQRVFLARALMQDGDVILLDEPFVGVDVPTQDLILGLLGRQATAGRTVIYATHDLEQARQSAGRVLLINQTVVADGPPEAVLTADTLRATFGGQVILLPDAAPRLNDEANT